MRFFDGAPWRAAFAACLAVACAKSRARPPPPAAGPGTGTPLGCRTLFDSATLNGKELQVDGGQPTCAADGLNCPLPDKFNAVCGGAGSTYAVCANQRWVLRCSVDAAAPRDAAGEVVPARDAAPPTDAGSDE